MNNNCICMDKSSKINSHINVILIGKLMIMNIDDDDDDDDDDEYVDNNDYQNEWTFLLQYFQAYQNFYNIDPYYKQYNHIESEY
ncbi:hypothetical protein DERF_010752 [Dermatophagoides farinae]|uniref:Uncharacterized protein n=1 Tax=Dermatophagoides farinae TaxID=6954 RepID=A0A922HTL2_DERFA|nr:hypothetical protein DERF_010752 [Dermatophagoides farinae]